MVSLIKIIDTFLVERVAYPQAVLSSKVGQIKKWLSID